MRFPAYTLFPLISGAMWLGTVLGLLLHWVVATHYTRYVSMAEAQTIAYISDVGAGPMKPLFIAGCVVTTVFLDLGFAADRWLRHRGRLVPNTTTGEKVLSGLTIAFAVVGTAGLILLSIFDTANHDRLHDIFLLLFIGGFVLSAIFICWEYQRLGIRNRDHRVLRISFWIKLAFVCVTLLLAISFVATTWTRHYNAGAVLEWVIAFIFSFYVFSFAVDLYPVAPGPRRQGRGYGMQSKGMAAATTEEHWMAEHPPRLAGSPDSGWRVEHGGQVVPPSSSGAR